MTPNSVSQLHGSTVFHEFDLAPSVEFALERFSTLPFCILLESSRATRAATGACLGRYSFLAADPFSTVVIDQESTKGLEQLREILARHSVETVPELPPFQGGLAGLLSYDLNRSIENVPAPRHNEFAIPDIAMGLYDVVLAWDHVEDRAWLISQGWTRENSVSNSEVAAKRLEKFIALLEQPLSNVSNQERTKACSQTAVELTESHAMPGPSGLTSNFSESQYLNAVAQAIEYIRAGDIFQVNLAQRLTFPADCQSLELYQRLRSCNPAPFSAYFDLGESQIVSASPERLLSVRGKQLETRPIKGTCVRTRFPQVDLHAQEQLKTSEKDRAENIMIVDLMRNDLSRVCTDDSICVTQLCEPEQYESVIHLVSAIQGTLRQDKDLIDVVEAVFPGGSITGAPKIRAMEIIAELEPNARGAYCGSLGYFGFDGSADLNILIRTITASKNWWQIPVGGGIVAQSEPEKEYKETWTKAAGMLRALTKS